MHEHLGSRQKLGEVEAGRAGYLMAPHSVESLWHSRDVDVASEGPGELSPGAHGHARGDAARAKVDEGTIARRGCQCGRLVQEPAVDGPLPRAAPGSGSSG